VSDSDDQSMEINMKHMPKVNHTKLGSGDKMTHNLDTYCNLSPSMSQKDLSFAAREYQSTQPNMIKLTNLNTVKKEQSLCGDDTLFDEETALMDDAVLGDDGSVEDPEGDDDPSGFNSHRMQSTSRTNDLILSPTVSGRGATREIYASQLHVD